MAKLASPRRPNQSPKVILSLKFTDGIEVVSRKLKLLPPDPSRHRSLSEKPPAPMSIIRATRWSTLPLTIDEDGDRTVGEDLDSHAAEQNAEIPCRPCEAMTIRSQCWLFAASIIA